MHSNYKNLLNNKPPPYCETETYEHTEISEPENLESESLENESSEDIIDVPVYDDSDESRILFLNEIAEYKIYKKKILQILLTILFISMNIIFFFTITKPNFINKCNNNLNSNSTCYKEYICDKYNRCKYEIICDVDYCSSFSHVFFILLTTTCIPSIIICYIVIKTTILFTRCEYIKV